jgi:hypothetical protein
VYVLHVLASSAPLRDLLDAPTALAACCGFDLCHKYILYLYLYLYFCLLAHILMEYVHPQQLQGSSLFLRGDSLGLNWNTGVAMTHSGGACVPRVFSD